MPVFDVKVEELKQVKIDLKHKPLVEAPKSRDNQLPVAESVQNVSRQPVKDAKTWKETIELSDYADE